MTALASSVRSWAIFGLFTLIVAAPQLPIYWAKAFGGKRVQHPDGRITPFIRLVPIWNDQARRENRACSSFTSLHSTLSSPSTGNGRCRDPFVFRMTVVVLVAVSWCVCSTSRVRSRCGGRR